MKKNKLKFLALIATGLVWAGRTHAQESVNASGKDASGSGGSVTYSVGQIVYTSTTGSNGSVDQSVQHAYEIFTVGVKELANDILLTAFPNPTAEYLTLQISNTNQQKLVYQLYDMQGKLVNNAQIVAQQTQIDMSDLPTSTYFVYVVNKENKKVQSFKIIKN